jgi:NADH dehydrogenase FAD-containing subunit
VGGGYGGATAAKYVRMWSDYGIQVTLIEPNASFISCPISNLVIGGSKSIEDVTRSRDSLRAYGVQVIRDTVTGINAEKKRVSLTRIEDLPYDKLVLSPGVQI